MPLDIMRVFTAPPELIVLWLDMGMLAMRHNQDIIVPVLKRDKYNNRSNKPSLRRLTILHVRGAHTHVVPARTGKISVMQQIRDV
jgi:hypothetical protein